MILVCRHYQHYQPPLGLGRQIRCKIEIGHGSLSRVVALVEVTPENIAPFTIVVRLAPGTKGAGIQRFRNRL